MDPKVEEKKKVTVKEIKMGGRPSLVTRDHCIPFDMITRIEFVDLDAAGGPTEVEKIIEIGRASCRERV